MKLVTLLTGFCCMFLCAAAQKDSPNQQLLKKCGRLTIPLQHKGKKISTASPLSVSSFQVVDYRPDTSRIGFCVEGRKQAQLFFDGNTADVLSSYLNAGYADRAGTRSMLIVIKKLWLYDSIAKLPASTIAQHPTGAGCIVFRLEAFQRTDKGFTPFAFLDTLVTSRRTVTEISQQKLPLILDDFVNKIALTDEAAVIKRNRVFSYNTIDSVYKVRFSYPMDNATVLKKGVYASVDEFRNNQPSVSQFEIRNEDGVLVLYIKDEKGQLYRSRKMWGCCDGEQCYAMMNEGLFPILSVNHAFYIWGYREYLIQQKSIPLLVLYPAAMMFGTMPVAETALKRTRLFTLDVHTGNIY